MISTDSRNGNTYWFALCSAIIKRLAGDSTGVSSHAFKDFHIVVYKLPGSLRQRGFLTLTLV